MTTVVKNQSKRYEIKKAEALKLHAEGFTPWQIAKVIGVDGCTVKAWIDPEYAAKRRETVMANKRQRYALKLARQGKAVRRYETFKPDPVASGAEMPPVVDTRDLTSRLMGDPMPGRSALEKRA